jgi:hypothetical protein
MMGIRMTNSVSLPVPDGGGSAGCGMTQDGVASFEPAGAAVLQFGVSPPSTHSPTETRNVSGTHPVHMPST